MNLKQISLASLALLSLPTIAIAADPVFLSTPACFQVLDISPNGKWGVGAYVDVSSNAFAFRWNLESGKIEMLSSSEPSMGWSISDDGVVAGNFACGDVFENGALVQMVGYYKDGKWSSVEIPSGSVSDGLGYSITPDGHYISGSVEINGLYTPFIWKDGKIDRQLPASSHSMPYCITADGQNAGGWTMTRNRTAVYWPKEGETVLFADSPTHSYTPWNCLKKFTSDGKKALYWGGWAEFDEEKDDTLYLYTVYNIETGEHIKVPAPTIDSDLEFFGISDSGLLVGETGGQGILYRDGKYMSFDEYLKTRGADIKKFDGFYNEEDYYNGEAPISRIMAVNPDETVFALRYFGLDGQSASLVVKLDQSTNRPVTDFEGVQLKGLSTVQLTWTPPVGTFNQGYNVYRDGTKISGFLPVKNKYYYNKDVAPGTYNYQIGTLGTDGKEVLSDVITVEVKDAKEPHSPYNLYARQKGVNGVSLTWSEPLNGLAHKSYYDEGSEDLIPFSVYEAVDLEAAICIPSHELSQYADFKLAEVSFYPMDHQDAWKLNCYSRGSNGALTLLASQPIEQDLILNQRNIVKLDEPLALPSNSDLIVAIQVTTNGNAQNVLAAQNGKVVAGYSDLLRQMTEDDFFSMYESSVAATYTVTSMAWAIDLGLAPADFSAEDAALVDYTIYMDDKKMENSKQCTYWANNLAEGKHTFAVEANYANGQTSPARKATIEITNSYPTVDEVSIVQTPNSGEVTFEWAAPVDDDVTDIAYTTQDSSAKGVTGSSYTGYALMAASIYPGSMLRSYENYAIKTLRFYPLADALFTLMVYENGELIYDTEVDEAVLNQWNEVEVDQEILIQSGAEYEFIIDCFDPEPGVPVLAVDNTPSFSYYSDLVSVNNGESWSTLADAGLTNNWMMGMQIALPEPEELEIDGYNLRVDSKQINTEMVKDTKFTYTFEPKANYTYRLNVYTKYASRENPLRGQNNYFTLQVSGINDAEIMDIVLRQGNNMLVAEGDGVKNITIYDISGKQSCRANGDTIDITNLSVGIYIVRVECESGLSVHKIKISK